LFVGGLRVQVQMQVQITFDFIRHDVRVYWICTRTQNASETWLSKDFDLKECCDSKYHINTMSWRTWFVAQWTGIELSIFIKIKQHAIWITCTCTCVRPHDVYVRLWPDSLLHYFSEEILQNNFLSHYHSSPTRRSTAVFANPKCVIKTNTWPTLRWKHTPSLCRKYQAQTCYRSWHQICKSYLIIKVPYSILSLALRVRSGVKILVVGSTVTPQVLNRTLAHIDCERLSIMEKIPLKTGVNSIHFQKIAPS